MSLSLGLGASSSSYVSEFLPTDISNLSLWLQNGVGIAAEREKWTDSSGNNNHALQSNDDNKASAISGGGLVLGNGVESFYNLTSSIAITQRQGFCFAYVAQNTATSNNTLFSDSSNEIVKVVNNAKLNIKTNAPSNVSTELTFSAGTLGQAKELILVNRTLGTPATYTVFKNGNSVTIDGDNSVNLTNSNGFDFDTLFADTVPSSPANFYSGTVFELLFFSQGLSSSQISDLNDYLTSKHGL